MQRKTWSHWYLEWVSECVRPKAKIGMGLCVGKASTASKRIHTSRFGVALRLIGTYDKSVNVGEPTWPGRYQRRNRREAQGQSHQGLCWTHYVVISVLKVLIMGKTKRGREVCSALLNSRKEKRANNETMDPDTMGAPSACSL